MNIKIAGQEVDTRDVFRCMIEHQKYLLTFVEDAHTRHEINQYIKRLENKIKFDIYAYFDNELNLN